MDATTLALFAGALLSLLTSYVPKFSTWFAALDSTTKSLLFAGALLVITLGIFGASCGQLGLPFAVTCDKQGAVGLAQSFLFSLIASQGIYAISPQTPEVKAIRAARLQAQAGAPNPLPAPVK